MTARAFGEIDGAPVFEVAIASKAGATAKILTWGAVLRELMIPTASGPQSVVLGLNSIDDYVKHSPHFGAVPGRYANRIANGRFTLDGVDISARPQTRRKAHAARRPERLRQADLEARRPRCLVRDADAGIAGRRRRLSRRVDGDLRLPDARAGDLAGRADGDDRQADDRQPDAAQPISISTARRTSSITR